MLRLLSFKKTQKIVIFSSYQWHPLFEGILRVSDTFINSRDQMCSAGVNPLYVDSLFLLNLQNQCPEGFLNIAGRCHDLTSVVFMVSAVPNIICVVCTRFALTGFCRTTRQRHHRRILFVDCGGGCNKLKMIYCKLVVKYTLLLYIPGTMSG